MTELIWYKDPSVLFSKESWYKFVPMVNMPVTEALNAVLRFTVYFAALMSATTSETQYLLIIPLVMVATMLFDQVLPDGTTLEPFSIKTKIKGLKENLTMPSNNNPFMNVLLTEIQDDPNRPDAAPINQRDVKEKIHKSFQHTNDMYMDTSDLFDQTQAMRTFHTMQSATVPNDLDGFKKWLAKGIDEPDYSSAAPARHGKIASEGYVEAKGSMKSLNSSTSKPTGTSPSPPATTSSK